VSRDTVGAMENGAPRYRWQRYEGREGFARVAADWGHIAESVSPLADPAWAGSFVDAFGGMTRRPTVHALYDGERLAAVLPIERLDRLARVWVSLDNEHSPYWLFPVDAAAPRVAHAILDHLLEDCDYVFFRRFHMNGDACKALVDAAREKGLPTSVIQNETGDAVVALSRPWNAFVEAMPKKLMKDTAYQLRRLQKMGALDLRILTGGGEGFDEAFAACLDIEARGWKGEEGSPIKSRPDTLRFYTQLAKTGRAALSLLELDGKILAFEYWLRGGGHIELLKISFDPDYAKNSPGYVLRYLALQREIEQGQATTYHMGRPSPWKQRWATSIEPLCSLRVYARTLRGRAAYLAGPVIRGRLKQMPLVQKARAALDRVRKRDAPAAAAPSDSPESS
jgi:CelD/BcsL family acetyltransferase involved in cellulose biosynthesis